MFCWGFIMHLMVFKFNWILALNVHILCTATSPAHNSVGQLESCCQRHWTLAVFYFHSPMAPAISPCPEKKKQIFQRFFPHLFGCCDA